MSTQLFKAKDVKSAINLVNQKFGEKAIILSTKQNNGVVEIEASDNDEVIKTHKKQIEENKNFSNLFLKKLDSKSVNEDKNNNVSFIRGKNEEVKTSKNDHYEKMYSDVKKQLESLRQEISGMILTDESGVSDKLSHFTPIKLRQEGFSSKIINKLNYSDFKIVF